MDNRFAGKLYRRVIHKYFLQDPMLDLRLRAEQETVDFVSQHLKTAMLFSNRFALLDIANKKAREFLSGIRP